MIQTSNANRRQAIGKSLAPVIALAGLLLVVSIQSAIQANIMPAQAQSSTLSASSTANVYGDFNGDGYDDLAIGVTGENSDAGAVNILYGGSSGLQTSSPADQLWTQDSTSILDSAESGDNFGSSLAAGDFDGDGYDDLAIGASAEDVGATTDAGAVNVIYGSSSGLTSTDNQFWNQDSTGVDDTAESGDLFGSSLAAGDFNFDGEADLAIGVSNEDVGAVGSAGAVNILYGGSSGLQTSSPADQLWTQDSTSILDSAESGDLFGSSLAVGDYDGDVFADLAIGALGEDIGAVSGAGAVNVIYGSFSGLTSTDNQFWNQDSTGILETAATGDNFGYSLAAGDFNVDGADDLAIGVPIEDVVNDSIDSAGLVNVIYGTIFGLSATPQDGTGEDNQIWWQNAPDYEETSAADDNFGFSLAAGDINGDGDDDLAIGVPFEDVVNDSIVDAGLVSVLHGTSTQGLTPSDLEDDEIWYQNSPNVEETSATGDLFGWSIAIGDFNDDGEDDLAVGVPSEDVVNDTIANAGLVNVLYGGSTGIQTTSPADQEWYQNAPNVEDTSEAGDFFGIVH